MSALAGCKKYKQNTWYFLKYRRIFLHYPVKKPGLFKNILINKQLIKYGLSFA
jgi:hypothetical protein